MRYSEQRITDSRKDIIIDHTEHGQGFRFFLIGGWIGGLVVWWFGGLVVWWFGGLVVQRWFAIDPLQTLRVHTPKPLIRTTN